MLILADAKQATAKRQVIAVIILFIHPLHGETWATEDNQ